MSVPHESRSLPDLIGGLANDISGLFRKEIDLAKAEASEKVSSAVGGIAMIAIGGVLALGALGVLLSAIVTAIAALFVNWGWDPTISNSIAALIVTVIVGIIAWIMISRGMAAFKSTNLAMERTTTSLNRDAAVVKERL